MRFEPRDAAGLAIGFVVGLPLSILLLVAIMFGAGWMLDRHCGRTDGYSCAEIFISDRSKPLP